LSGKSGTYVVVGALGQVTAEGKVELTQAGLKKGFGSQKPTRIAIEVGTHSPWVSPLLAELGHEVIVANARQVKLISQNKISYVGTWPTSSSELTSIIVVSSFTSRCTSPKSEVRIENTTPVTPRGASRRVAPRS
jgi:hypothetical protein